MGVILVAVVCVVEFREEGFLRGQVGLVETLKAIKVLG